MAHPMNDKRANKVERARVGRFTSEYENMGNADHAVKHYATGGAVKAVNNASTERASGGKVATHRADRFARGGKVKGKKGNTTVNVVVGHHGMPAGGPQPMAAAPPMAAPPRPMAPPILPAGGPPGGAPPAGAPMMPPPGIRATGGRVRATGGGVMKGVDDGGDNGADRELSGKGDRMGGIMTASLGVKDVAGREKAAMERNYGEGRKKGGRVTQRATGGGVNGVYPTGTGTKVWRSSVMDGTPVQHSGNKSDGQSIGRDKVITYKTGGAVEHAVKGQMAPHLPGGAGGGEARLVKAHKLHKAVKGVHSDQSGK